MPCKGSHMLLQKSERSVTRVLKTRIYSHQHQVTLSKITSQYKNRELYFLHKNINFFVWYLVLFWNSVVHPLSADYISTKISWYSFIDDLFKWWLIENYYKVHFAFLMDSGGNTLAMYFLYQWTMWSNEMILVANHYLNHCWFIVNWTLSNNFQ